MPCPLDWVCWPPRIWLLAFRSVWRHAGTRDGGMNGGEPWVFFGSKDRCGIWTCFIMFQSTQWALRTVTIYIYTYESANGNRQSYSWISMMVGLHCFIMRLFTTCKSWAYWLFFRRSLPEPDDLELRLGFGSRNWSRNGLGVSINGGVHGDPKMVGL